MLTIIRTNSDNTDFISLIKLLDAALLDEYGEMQKYYGQFNKVDKIKNVCVAYVDDAAVGCGAFKKFDDESVEVKRMYVKDDFRGRQIAKEILQELETWAKELGYGCCVLETGVRSERAIALYQKNGYEVTPNYGQYIGIETSVCMKKKI